MTVVDDQVGRLTFTDDMARGILWLLGYRDGDIAPSRPSPFGTYDLTGSGRSASWCEIACRVFDLRNGNGDAVAAVSTDEYSANGPTSPRPEYSTLDLSKVEATGFRPRDWEEKLVNYANGIER